MANDIIQFEIKEHVGTVAMYQTGWAKELNVVSWNGGVPKYDIRDWSPNHERMTRGITLTEEEAESLMKVFNERFNR